MPRAEFLLGLLLVAAGGDQALSDTVVFSGEVSRLRLPFDFSGEFFVEEGDPISIEIAVSRSAADLRPSDEGVGLYAADFARYVIGDYVYETPTGVTLGVTNDNVFDEGANDIFALNFDTAGSVVGLPAPTPVLNGFSLRLDFPEGDTRLFIYLPTSAFPGDGLPLDELVAAAAGGPLDDDVQFEFVGDQRVEFSAEITNIFIVPEPHSLALVGLMAILLSGASRRAACVQHRR